MTRRDPCGMSIDCAWGCSGCPGPVDPIEPEECEDCGKLRDSFACRVRHIYMNTGAAKAAND